MRLTTYFVRSGHIKIYMSGENNILWDRPIIEIAYLIPSYQCTKCCMLHVGLLFGES